MPVLAAMRVFLSAVVGLAALAVRAEPVLVERIAVVLDGRPIFLSEVLRQARRDAPQAKTGDELRKAQERARSALIEAALIAKDLGSTPTDAELEQALDEVSKTAKLDRAGLEAAVTQQGLSFAEYREMIKSQLLEMRWLLTRARERNASIATDAERQKLRAELVAQLRKRAVIEVFE